MATTAVLRSAPKPWTSAKTRETQFAQHKVGCFTSSLTCASQQWRLSLNLSLSSRQKQKQSSLLPIARLSSSSPKTSTKLYVSGLSFRTTEDSLRNAFQDFGQLVEVNLVMDRLANRPRGFAFLRYETQEESKKAIEGMHGKFLDGRVIFVEVAKPRTELRQTPKQNQRRY